MADSRIGVKSSTNIGRLAYEITKMLRDYSSEVVEQVDRSSERIGKEVVKQLKVTSPKRSGGGNYARAWKMTTFEYFNQPSTRIIHVKAPYYRLTHLLEKGHAKRNGGRVEGIPHIRPAEQEVIRQFTREVEEAIRNGAS